MTMTSNRVVIDLAAVTSAVSAANAAPRITSNWNGSLGKVDLAKPTDYTTDLGKIVVQNNVFSLRGTLEYLFWVCQDKPTAKTAISQAHIDAFIPLAQEMIARYRIYKVFHEAGMDPIFRKGDTRESSDLDTTVVQERAVAEIHDMLITEGAREDEIAAKGQLVLFSIVANAIHREQNEGHSWFSEELINKRSATSKTLGVAGRLKDTFAAYMEKRGHDGNHHLSDSTIAAYAKVLSQEDRKPQINDTKDIMYGGRNIRNMIVADVFRLGEAVIGRYPAGILGKAAIVVGTGMIVALFNQLSTKVKISGATSITTNATRLGNAVKGINLPHSVLLEIGNVLGPAFATTYGVLNGAGVLNEDSYKAFSNHAKRYPSELASGTAIAKTLKAVAPHVEAITGAITTALTAIAAALEKAANVVVPAVGTGTPTKVLTNVESFDHTKIKAEVGRITGGMPQQFYDALDE